MAADTGTTTTEITVATSLIVAIDSRVENGEFVNRDELISRALARFLERPSRYEELLQEGIDDLDAGRFEEATPEFFERLRNEARARARERRLTGERWIPDPDVFGPFDDR